MALTHNLTLLLERKIESEEGISDTKIEKKRKRRIEGDRRTIREAGRKENPLVNQPCKAVQRSFQFLRWLRDALLVRASWDRLSRLRGRLCLHICHEKPNTVVFSPKVRTQ